MAQKRKSQPRTAVNRPKNSSTKSGGKRTAASSKSAPKKSSTKSKSQQVRAEVTEQDTTFRKQVAAVVLFALGILLVCLVLITGESAWESMNQILYGLFGVLALPMCVPVFVVAVMLALDKPASAIAQRVGQVYVCLLMLSACVNLVFSPSTLENVAFGDNLRDCYMLGTEKSGAGAVGAIVGGSLQYVLGKVGAIIVLVLALFIFVMLVTKTSLASLINAAVKPAKAAKAHTARVREERAARRAYMEEMLEEDEYERQEAARSTQKSRRVRTAPVEDFDINVPVDDPRDYSQEEPSRRTSRRSAQKVQDESVSVVSPEEDADEEERLDRDMEGRLSKLLHAVGLGEETARSRKKRSAQDVLTEPESVVLPDDEEEQTPQMSEEQPAQEEQPEETMSDLDKVIARAQQPKGKKAMAAAEIEEQAQVVAAEIEQHAAQEQEEVYEFPPIDLLTKPDESEDGDASAEHRHNAERLIATLEEYGVRASVSEINRGPTVTRYEITPAPGVKISRITNLDKDIALRLAATSIRIEAPIPGKPAVGIEIPNKERKTVHIRQLIEAAEFRRAKGQLVAVVGTDIEGNVIVCDIAKMPHLLIAGSTGSGKSVCVNSMLISLMYRYTPNELRMVLVDPKSVEFQMYNGIPHLLVPVVTEPKKAAGVLQWAVAEMQKRYKLLNERNVRSLEAYNKIADETGEFEKMPRIIIVIDEMADLMQTTPKEVEDAIQRLAAMARAAGMHMILATQRPSVDVITGTIKNNIPSRIALTVSSAVDSRTILDMGGAETLIGYGDMLYNPMGIAKPKRVQGCFVSDSEVESVINFLTRNGSAEYDQSIAQEIDRRAAENSDSSGASGGGGSMEEEDPILLKAIEAVVAAGQASTSMLQRKLGVGYAKAGRMIDQLEERGIVGPYEGSKPRQVLITRAQWLEMSMNNGFVNSPQSAVPAAQESIAAPAYSVPTPIPVEETPPFDIDEPYSEVTVRHASEALPVSNEPTEVKPKQMTSLSSEIQRTRELFAMMDDNDSDS